jgi:hypothetical protein
MSFDRCSKMCAGAAADGHNWRIDQESCSEIKKAFVTDKWMCWAEGSIGTAVGSGPYTYSTKSLSGTGNTRDEAGYDAVTSCNAILGTSKNLAWSGGQTVDAGSCEVTRCLPPGTPL